MRSSAKAARLAGMREDLASIIGFFGWDAVILAAAVLGAFFFILAWSGSRDEPHLLPLCDALFDPGSWALVPQTRAFGILPLGRFARGRRGGESLGFHVSPYSDDGFYAAWIWLEFDTPHDFFAGLRGFVKMMEHMAAPAFASGVPALDDRLSITSREAARLARLVNLPDARGILISLTGEPAFLSLEASPPGSGFFERRPGLVCKLRSRERSELEFPPDLIKVFEGLVRLKQSMADSA